MTCQECQLQMPEHVQSSSAEGPCSEHLQQCAECRQLWQELQSGLSVAGLWQVPPPSADLVDRAMARLASSRQSGWRGWLQAVDEALQRFGQHRLSWRSGAFTAVVAVALMSRVLAPNFLRGRSTGAEVACQRSERVLKQALESYAHDHGGQYPSSLQQLQPGYLKSIPRCPESSSQDGSGYEVDRDFHSYRLQCPHHRR